jgi:ATP-dependent RNA helicase DDX24/MAK5
VDVSAWKDYFLQDEILNALSRLGFSAPTHIQAECLPAAIRDRRDIIGAAQTVRLIILSLDYRRKRMYDHVWVILCIGFWQDACIWPSHTELFV